jgi:hypothetical protein
LLCLGGVLRGQKKLEEAEDCCRRCLALREELYNSQHADVAGALTGMVATVLTLKFQGLAENVVLKEQVLFPKFG